MSARPRRRPNKAERAPLSGEKYLHSKEALSKHSANSQSNINYKEHAGVYLVLILTIGSLWGVEYSTAMVLCTLLVAHLSVLLMHRKEQYDRKKAESLMALPPTTPTSQDTMEEAEKIDPVVLLQDL